jgi:tetratricopeptide (TPR) repeat protein
MPVRGSRRDHVILLIAFPGLIALALLVERVALAPWRAARSDREELAIWSRFAEDHPTFATAQVRLGQAQLRVGDRDGAIASFEHALALDPDLETAALGLSQLHRDAGDRARAAAVLEPFVVRQPNCLECWQDLAADALAAGDLERASADIERVLRSGAYLPSVTNSSFSLARARFLAGRIEEARGSVDAALNDYAAALRLDARLASAHQRAGALLVARDPRAAAVHLEQYRAQNPGDLHGALPLATAYRELGDVGSARRVLEEIRAESAKRPPPLRRRLELDVDTQLAALDARDGDLERARERLERVLALAPEDADARTLLTDVRERLAAQP